MSKKVFILLVLLMSLSLIGIIFVQAYFINKTFDNEDRRFSFNVKKALDYVSKVIEERESQIYFLKYQSLIDNKEPDSVIVRQLLVLDEDENTDETIIYSNGILEENYKLSSLLFDNNGLDTITLKRLTGERSTKTVFGSRSDKDFNFNTENVLFHYGRLTKTEQLLFESTYRDYAKRRPIHKRVSVEEINRMLKLKLLEDDIDIDFQFAIYSKDLATKIQSEDFNYEPKKTYQTKIFLDNEGQSNFNLLVNFPKREQFIYSSIISMLLLSIVFTAIIIIAFLGTIFQLNKQRKISLIKTDFINNMTHEFKTPIATINLALDAIKNPQIIGNQEKLSRYLKMIREENKRMHAQVENVLRISRLEKNELNIKKEREKLHDIIEDAITHVELMVEDRNGTINKHFNAVKTSVLANETHFTNVIVNILDNAIKYSPDELKIDIYTENVGNNVLLKIKDQGSGMSKVVQKRIFEKFYREHTGDIHNTKGHGLGLAYVRRIINDHQGHISVESEKGKGATFTIKLPLIS